jgi:nitrite reductase/ring-hydroxylating ferredoxin subunit
MCFTNQASFHPRKYLLGIAKMIPGNGSYIFENSRAVDVHDGKPCEVRTAGGTVTAQYAVIATSFPIVNRGLIFAKMHVQRSYLMAVHLNKEMPEGMYINTSSPMHTLRSHVTESGDTLWLIGGEEHPTGQERDTIRRYERVTDFIRKNFDIKSIDYRWSAQDSKPVDRLPFIGRFSPAGSRVYVATGFQGWGMTNGTVAGRLLSDLIIGRENPWTNLFDPGRLTPFMQEKFITRGIDLARQYIGGKLETGMKPAAELQPGEGAVVQKSEEDKEKIGAFKDDKGGLHTISTTCQHMGCEANWNNAEETWDCPCHGSRYDFDGKVIEAPTVKDLQGK